MIFLKIILKIHRSGFNGNKRDLKIFHFNQIYIYLFLQKINEIINNKTKK